MKKLFFFMNLRLSFSVLFPSFVLTALVFHAHAAPFSFAPPHDYPTKPNVLYLGAGDFNKDGHMDIFVGRMSDFSIKLGNGQGELGQDLSFSLNKWVSFYLVGDFNADGAADIMLGTGIGYETRLNTSGVAGGPIVFSSQNEILFNEKHVGAAVSGPFFSGDHRPDLIIDDIYKNELTFAKGDGHGNFGNPQVIPYTNADSPGDSGSIAPGDFNQDGFLDLVFTNDTEPTISVLLGNQDGFEAGIKSNAGDDMEDDEVAVADFNGDAKPDVALLHGKTKSVQVLMGSGDGTFQAPISVGNVGQNPKGIAAVDMNHDKKPDLAVGSEKNSEYFISVLINITPWNYRPTQESQKIIKPFVPGLRIDACGALSQAICKKISECHNFTMKECLSSLPKKTGLWDEFGLTTETDDFEGNSFASLCELYHAGAVVLTSYSNLEKCLNSINSKACTAISAIGGDPLHPAAIEGFVECNNEGSTPLPDVFQFKQ